MKRLATLGVVAGLLLGGLAMPGQASAQGAPELYGPGLKLTIDEDKNMYIRFLTWLQVWGRVTQTNPGTTVAGSGDEWQADAMLRRARFLTFAQLTDHALILMHFGINNQVFDDFRPQLYFHDFFVEFKTWEKFLYLGGGLIYGLGNSRMTSASTLNFLALDSPIFHWATIEATDQFARQLGFFARGDIEGFHYKVNLTRPYVRATGAFSSPDAAGAAALYNTEANSWALSGYFSYDFFSVESHKLPYRVGTYLGTKRVFNVGAGFNWHSNAMVRCANEENAGACPDGEQTFSDMFLLSVDTFLDLPIGDGAFTGYLSYSYYDFGQDNLRRVGIANLADSGGAFGNAYPMIGTGHHVYGQLGYLLPFRPWDQHKIMPYFTTQASLFEVLDDAALIYELGLKYYLIGHHASVTLHWRNRPTFVGINDTFDPMDPESQPFVTSTNEESRANEFIVQLQIWL